MSGKRAPSLHFHHHEKVTGDIVLQDVLVPQDGSAECTYYCCICWNSGQNGGGYCGIQDHPDGRCYIFSIWDPKNSTESIIPTFKGPGTVTSAFGGEGTGLKSINSKLGWNPDTWYTLVTRRWDHSGHTWFGLWVHDQTVGKWTHVITMDFPEPNILFNHTSSFLEDWRGNGHLMRSVKFRNGWKRAMDGNWHALHSAKFSVNQEDATKMYNNNFTASADEGCFFMQSGHTTKPEDGLGTSKDFTCEGVDEESSDHCPRQPPISFSVTNKAEQGIVSWQVPESSTPQFRFTIKVGNKVLTSEVEPETREYSVDLSGVSMVTVILEDVLGRKVSHDVKVL